MGEDEKRGKAQRWGGSEIGGDAQQEPRHTPATSSNTLLSDGFASKGSSRSGPAPLLQAHQLLHQLRDLQAEALQWVQVGPTDARDWRPHKTWVSTSYLSSPVGNGN